MKQTKTTKTILAAGAISSLGLATAVQADDTVETTPTTSQVTESQAQAVTQDTVTQAQSQVETTNNQVMVATAEVNQAQSTVDTATTEAQTAQTNLETAQNLLAQAEAQEAQAQTAPSQETLMTKDSVALGSEEYAKSKGVSGKNYLGVPTNSWSYSGDVEEVVELTPEQAQEFKETGDFTYKPDMVKVNEYMAQYINEFNAANGIEANVKADAETIRFSQARAEENVANNRDGHKTDLTIKNDGPALNELMLDGDKNVITYDKARAGENAGSVFLSFDDKKKRDINSAYAFSNLRSDQELAYNLFMGWFTDTDNILLNTQDSRQDVLDGKLRDGAVGHRNGMMGRFGYIGLGLAQNTNGRANGPYKGYQAILNFSVDNTAEAKAKDSAFAVDKIFNDTISYQMVDKGLTSNQGNKVSPTLVQYYKGKEVTAGPRRTFKFVAKTDTATLKAETAANLLKAQTLLAKAQEQKVNADSNLSAALASLEAKRQVLKEAVEARDEAVSVYNKTKANYEAQLALETVKPVETPKVVETVKPVEAPKADTPKVTETVKPAQAPKADAPKVTETVKPVETPKADAPKVTETVKPVETPKADAPKMTESVKSVEVPKADAPKVTETVKPVEAPKADAPKVTETVKSVETNRPADYQKLVAKVNQAMSKAPMASQAPTPTAQQSTGQELPNTGTKDNSLLALVGMSLLGLVGLGHKKKDWRTF